VSNQRTHEVTTTDGVVIGGTVHGQGPPLVFVHGSLGDGDLDWQALLPHLTGRFTCYLPSRRGRGLTADHADHSLGRVVDDIIAYVDSLEGPTGLVGWSAGATLTLAAAAQLSDAGHAVAVYEPPLGPLMEEQQRAARVSAVARMGELVAEGRLTDGARRWAEFVFHDEETAALESAGYLEATGRYVPVCSTTSSRPCSSEGPILLIRRSSRGSRRRCWCCTDRRPGRSSPRPRGTWPTMSPTHGYRRSPAPATPPR
jgi:pimeloyl-ACP methyl ester carboxylesterase